MIMSEKLAPVKRFQLNIVKILYVFLTPPTIFKLQNQN